MYCCLRLCCLSYPSRSTTAVPLYVSVFEKEDASFCLGYYIRVSQRNELAVCSARLLCTNLVDSFQELSMKFDSTCK